MLDKHATFESGGYSTEAGVMDMLARMRSDRFKVAAGCIEWQEEFAGYHRKDGLIVKTNVRSHLDGQGCSKRVLVWRISCFSVGQVCSHG